jgi:ribosomal protein S18 acetylase RimI-like enzyme
MDADQIASSMADLWEYLLPRVPGLRMVRKGGAYAFVNSEPSPVNGVYFEGRDPDPGTVAALLDEAAASGLPYMLQTRPTRVGRLTGPVAALVAGRGMVPAEDVPLMLLESADLRRPAPIGGFAVRPVAPAEVAQYIPVAAAGFEMPAAPLEQLINRDVLAAPGVRCYLGLWLGEPIATAVSMTFGALTSLINISTVPGQRGRGFGTAITAHAVSEARGAGSPWCWLHSTPDGYPVYERLGFRTIETATTWQSPE